MNCNEARRHWNLYHDSEGDAELHFRINEHLAECASCAEWFHEQSRVEDLMVGKLAAVKPSAELWNLIRRQSAVASPAPRTRWFLGSLLALAATVVMGLVIWQLLSGSETARLTELTVAWHDRLVQGRTQVEFASESDLEVEGYLRQRVNFPVRCPPRQDAGFLVRGAGTCRLSGHEAAYLIGQVAEVPVSIFILPQESLARFPQDRIVLERELIHHGREGHSEMVMGRIDRNVVLVIGRTEPARLERVLTAYGTYPDHHAG